MNTCYATPNTGLQPCPKPQNEMLLEALPYMSGDLRKAMKLLGKQYQIIEMLHLQGEDTLSDCNRVVKRNLGLYVIRYMGTATNEVFTWTINPNEIKN